MKTMAYYFFKWHSRAQVLQAQLFQPLPRTQEQRGRQEREAHRALLTPQFVSTFLPTRPRSRLFWNSKTGSFSPHSCKWLTHCRKPLGDRHSPGGGAARGGAARSAQPHSQWAPWRWEPGCSSAAPAQSSSGRQPCKRRWGPAKGTFCQSTELGEETGILTTAALARGSSQF